MSSGRLSAATLFIGLRTAVYAAGFLLLWGWVARASQAYDSRLPFTVSPGMAPLGWLLIAAGALVLLPSLASFVVRGRGTPGPFDPPRRLVPSGPYRFVRNPLYLGAALLLAGYGLRKLSPSILILDVILLGVAHLFVVLVEEPGLESRFGEEYRRYREEVPRWIPRFRRTRRPD